MARRGGAGLPRLGRAGWMLLGKNAVAGFQKDQGTDLAAGLTYYSVLSIFPGLLALVSLLGVFGQGEETVDELLKILTEAGVGGIDTELRTVLEDMATAGGAGLALVAGLAGAVWSASGYVGAFGRMMNRVYDVTEGRPVWVLRPLQLALTIGLIVLAAVVLVGLVVSGPVVEVVGAAVGLGPEVQSAWNLAKWPVMLLIVVAIVAVLYYATPNVRQPRRVVSFGAALAILIWVLASAGFGFYVSHFSSYNKTYGSLAGIIVFLLWLWLTNVALVFGAEVDAELERSRQLRSGIAAEQHIQLPVRDARQSAKASEKRAALVAAGRELREAAVGVRDAEPYAGERAGLEPLPSEQARHRS